MVIRTFKSKIEFELFLKENLNYETISVMDFDEYKSFVYNLFNDLDKDEIKDFVNKQYSTVMQSANDSDILFVRIFLLITEEIVEFCPNPFFGYRLRSIYQEMA